MKYLFFSLLLLGLTACGNTNTTTAEQTSDTAEEQQAPELNTDESAAVPKLEMAWETDTVLTTCESVYFDADTESLYVSNIEENPWEKDGKGSISVISRNGDVVERDFVTELNAPKGMGVYGGHLFVADLDAVVEINLEDRSIVERHEIEGASGLNDIDIDEEGVIYVTDSHQGKVHRGGPDGFKTIVDDMQRPNGVLITFDGVLLGDTEAETLSLLKPDGSREVMVKGVQPDGIVELEQGGLIISRWGGEIHYISPEWEATSIYTSDDEMTKTADLGYEPGLRMILVPNFFANKVTAYRLSW